MRGGRMGELAAEVKQGEGVAHASSWRTLCGAPLPQGPILPPTGTRGRHGVILWMDASQRDVPWVRVGESR